MTNGRLEKELIAQAKMDDKLKNYPEIFKKYYLYLRAAGRTYSTINVYINGLIRFATFVCGDKIINNFYQKITTSDVEEFLISLETTVRNGQTTRMSSDARCTYWSYLNTFWNFLVKRDYVLTNIIEKTDRPKNNDEKQVIYLTRSEVTKLMKAVIKNPDIITRARDRAIMAIGFSLGLRVSALTNINIDDVDFDNATISVIEKENKSRKLEFGDNMASALQEWINYRNNMCTDLDTDALFVSQKGNRISPDAVNDMMKKYANQIGLEKKISFHKCRATLAVNALSAGVPAIAVSKQLGHNNVSTLQHYADALNEDKKKLTNLMDKFV